MIVYDFFAGTGSATKPFEDRGHKVIKVELDEHFEADERDILKLMANELIAKYGRPDFIWASPPCQKLRPNTSLAKIFQLAQSSPSLQARAKLIKAAQLL